MPRATHFGWSIRPPKVRIAYVMLQFTSSRPHGSLINVTSILYASLCNLYSRLITPCQTLIEYFMLVCNLLLLHVRL